jgi:hypothetical protein
MDSVANVAGFGLGGVIEISDDSTPQQTAEYVASVPTFVTASGVIGQPASLGALLTSVVVWPTSCHQIQIAPNLAARKRRIF